MSNSDQQRESSAILRVVFAVLLALVVSLFLANAAAMYLWGI